MSTFDAYLKQLLVQLSSRHNARTEADIQGDIAAFLTAAQLNLHEAEVVRREVQTADGTRRRIDIEVGQCVIEVKKDLQNQRALADAEKQLAGYVTSQSARLGTRYVGVLTDGRDWFLYRLQGDALRKVDEFKLPKPADINVDSFRVWIESILATEESVKPTPEEIGRRLGVESPSYQLDHQQLTDLYNLASTHPEVQMKRHLWARLLRTALGSSFKDDAALFVDHTLLVMEANIIAHAVIGIDLHASNLTPAALFSGARFHEAQIYNVVQSDFFDWVLKASGGESFVRNLVRQIRRFSWSNVEHDVLKVLYESVISQQTRKSLGEYYTADWLAEKVVEETVTSPLTQRVLDPACGSGTFVFHAVRHHLHAADTAGMSNAEAITSVTNHVFGMDIHPVSAVLARVTYLLAIGLERLQDRDALSVPVYLGDSMQWSR
ncbi:N-6 DNA methylase, partial [Streptomyces nigra]